MNQRRMSQFEPRASGKPCRYSVRVGRRGAALLMVTLLLSMTLVLTYAIMRSQTMDLMIQTNAQRREQARQAAMSGMHAGLHEMHQVDWAGVDRTISRPLGDYERFDVTFTTGDASLGESDPDYDEYPFRVTLKATGYAVDPSRPQSVSVHTVEAVVRLVPRALADSPSNFSTLTRQTVCQTGRGKFDINVPCRIEGSLQVRDTLDLCDDIDWKDDMRDRYLKDLNGMRKSGTYGDYRPVTGPISLPFSKQQGEILDVLRDDLEVTLVDESAEEAADWVHPGGVKAYRLYPGGKEYKATRITSTSIWHTSYEPDPLTNPIGLLYLPSYVTVGDEVTIKGTIIGDAAYNSDIYFQGENVHVTPVDLPPLQGSTDPIQVPVIVLKDDVRVRDGSSTKIEGLVCLWDEFQVESSHVNGQELTVEGVLAIHELAIDRRYGWSYSTSSWKIIMEYFEDYEDYYDMVFDLPVWLDHFFGLAYRSNTQIKSPSRAIRYHWLKANEPIYVPGPDDQGLRWEVIRWTDSP